MIIYDPKITGSFEVNGSSLSSLESIDNVSGSVVDLTAASSSLSTRVSDQESFSSSLDTTFATDAQVSTAVSSLNAATSSYLLNTTDTLTGDLTVTGTLTAQDLHVQEVTSSIVFSSGSNKFGENVSDTQKFTGSLQVSGSIDLEDNAKIKIGTGNDLQIYHDGSNSYINEAGTGVLSIQSDGTEVQINKGSSEYMGRFIADAGVKLYYNNSLKFETLDTGVDVTGDINIDAGKKLAYSSTAFMTPENNVTGAEISTPGDFRVKTGNSPTLALTLGGSQDATFTSTVQIGDGSATNLSLGANSSDFELSAKKNGTDAISMVFKTQASGGTLSEAMRIDSSGHVGIGITPNVNSTVVNVIQLGKGMTLLGNANDDRATMAANLYLDTGTAFRYVMDGLAGRFSIEDGNMIWGTAGSGTEGTVATVDTKMTLLNNGSLGIGTNSPNEKLDVENGNIRIKSNSDGNTGVLRMYDAAGTESGQIYPSAGDLRFYTPNDIIMSPTGKVGIGTTSPTGKLSVETNGNHLHLRANTATAGKYWNFDITSDNQLYIVNNGGTGIQVLDNGKVGIGGTPEQKLHVEGRGIFDGGASSDILQIRNDNGSGVFGMTPNLFALDLASTSNFRIRQGSTVPLYLKSDGNLGIGTTNPFAPLQVNGTHSTLNAHFGQGTNNSNGVFGGISLGYSESNALYRKVGIVAQAKGDNSARQDLHFLVRIASDQNSAGIADSKMMIAHDTGYVGIATAAPAVPLHVHGNIQSKEGIISPTFYVARNYGSTSGNFAGYDDIVEGDIIDIKDHSIGSLNSFAHGQLDPVINGSSDSIDWNYFRLLFRYTNNSATYTNYTVGFKVARYFYSAGWTENSAEFSGNGMDGARGPRWAVSPWTTLGGTDVPGIGLKYYDNYTHTQTIRVHAIYIQYKS
jgi:hypothetical protein